MRWILGLMLILSGTVSLTRSADVEIVLQNCTYPQLGELVRQSKGKVVLVDFWAEFCLPCKKKFPDVVALQKKYLSQGLRCFSVSVDDFEDAEARD